MIFDCGRQFFFSVDNGSLIINDLHIKDRHSVYLPNLEVLECK